MALLEILHFPDLRLRKKALPVNGIDDQVRQTVADMFETMYDACGVGLAATQVNIQRQIVVIDVSENKDTPLCLINPKIIVSQGEKEIREGCLSVPGIFDNVYRAEAITVEALDQHGKLVTHEADGLFAICVQHEIDHLEGKLFVDYLSPLKRQRIKKKLSKQQKHGRVVRDDAQHANVI